MILAATCKTNLISWSLQHKDQEIKTRIRNKMLARRIEPIAGTGDRARDDYGGEIRTHCKRSSLDTVGIGEWQLKYDYATGTTRILA